MKRVSNIFIFVGAFAFAFAIYSFMTFSPAKATQHHKLKLAPNVGAQAADTLIPTDGPVDIS